MALLVEKVPFGMQKDGLFGFLRSELLFDAVLMNGFFAGFWGVCGYVVALMFFSPVVVMNCFLLEPIVG